ncbi:hypothetical protein [Neorhizobium galegae]|uniref:hypothetical protein n=1 Tax=Neorhizobium galegae TaxID=399 RepID=UPI00062259DA|nr:hypothetical protein [Neorhizobium galegae]KAB1124472.1 hypothetical protein F4V90_12800 [Neorhizobium galegae]MCQ1804815.1 hypothetical protein [Neorhizobium galegae]UIK03978.1 hypothetical protein LZK81_14880 [Neorhizobium galegae]CDZ57666.1 Hypothetical protein NGAL_HAMBI2566_22210 [Neorhizobium galegae bv. orientalis]
MLSAGAYQLPLKSSRPVSVWRQFRRFFRRLLQPASPSIPALPDDLRGDVALPEAGSQGREAAFWDGKRRSGGRDLPL